MLKISRRKIIGLTVFIATGIAILVSGYLNATSDPVVRYAIHRSSEWPAGEKSVRIAFLSDIHASEPGATAKHIAGIVDLVNEQKPDIILIGGDFVSTKQLAWSKPDFAASIAPLVNLKSAFGTYAVLGNHDHWRSTAEGIKALENIGITVLDNEAVQTGPLSLGGVDDAFTHHANISGTISAMKKIKGARVLLSHSPDVMPEVKDVDLILAGHTHCGQVSLPFIGPIVTMSEFGDRYACGLIEEDGKTLIVGAGTGTSLIPIRF